jgi:ECF transporter S component (folate family)
MQKRTKQNIEMLVVLALLTALDVIMGRFLSINSTFFKLDTSFIPMVIAAYFYGPIGSMAVAGLGDFIGALLFPFGPYMPHFTISAALTGVIFGLALKGKPSFTKCVLAVVPSQLVCSLILNSLFLEILYGNVVFWLRLVQTVLSTPIQIAVTFLITKKVIPLVKLKRTNSKTK